MAHDRLVLGQRYLMDQHLESGAIKQGELLNIPSDSWNWRLNEFWISSAALLGKTFSIYCDQVADVKELIDHQANILDQEKTANIVPLWHAEFKRPTLLARELQLLAHLNYRFETSIDSVSSAKLIVALPANR